jgi:hypothetical protein
MKEQHTPGPWTVSEDGSIEFADGYLGEAYDFNGTTRTDLPMMANARLMAAAPELLQALQELHEAGLTMKLPRYVIALANAKKLIAEHTNEK